jgi:primosomal protein N' (replication factor Y) (superfamily II helicase)
VPGDEEASRVVRVLCDVPALRKSFDYLAPPAPAPVPEVGTEVRVLLHGRRVRGWVVAAGVVPPTGVALRPLIAVRGWGPPPAVVELASWAAWRWAGPVSSFLATASSPTVLRTSSSLGPPPGTLRARRASDESPPSDISPEVVDEAFGGGTAVVRIAPATDAFDVVVAATRRLANRTRPDAGVLVLAPSHGDATAVARRLRRFALPVALLPDDWGSARAGGIVAVGTRSAAWAPLPALASAVVLGAHDEVYQEERSPTWNAWAVVSERARRDGAPCVLVSACPTLDLLEAGRLVTTSRQAERVGWPPVEVVDRRSDDPRQGLFSEPFVTLARWGVAEPGRRVVCVLNRTGRVRTSACASCRELVRCARCAGAVEQCDGTPSVLRCRRCGEERPVVCAHCGATRLRALRIGVSKAREELQALLRSPVAEVTGASRDHDLAAAQVVVGTEAVLHRVERADAVTFLDFDSELLAPRIRADEEALGLLARAARVVGGAPGGSTSRAAGRILVQTRQPDHPVLLAALWADPGRLTAGEAEIRRSVGLPPFGALALLSGPEAPAYARALGAVAPAGVSVGEQADGTWAVRAGGPDQLSDLLAAVVRPAGRLRVAVDPLRA